MRILRGRVRVVAAISCVAVAGVLAFAGWSLLIGALIVGTALLSDVFHVDSRQADDRVASQPVSRRNSVANRSG